MLSGAQTVDSPASRVPPLLMLLLLLLPLLFLLPVYRGELLQQPVGCSTGVGRDFQHNLSKLDTFSMTLARRWIFM